MRTNKLVLPLLFLLGAFSCSPDDQNEETVDKLSLISDREILDFKLAVIKQTESINFENFEKYKKYPTYEDFKANTTPQQQKEMIEELNIRPIEDLTLITKVFNLKLSVTDFDRLKKRVNEIPLNIPVGKVNNCYSFCFDYKMEVYWNSFWSAQNSGQNMYDAHATATTASGWAYNGCMEGCAYLEPPEN